MTGTTKDTEVSTIKTNPYKSNGDSSCINVCPKGEKPAFGGYIGGRLSSVKQAKEESENDVWIEKREVIKGTMKRGLMLT